MHFKSPLGKGLCPCSLPVGTRERGADGYVWEVVHHPQAHVRIWVRPSDRGGQRTSGGRYDRDRVRADFESRQVPQLPRRYAYGIQQVVDAFNAGTIAEALRVLANVADTTDARKLAHHLRDHANARELAGGDLAAFLRTASALLAPDDRRIRDPR